VREGAVERDGGDHRHALGAPRDVGDVEPEQAFADDGGDRFPDLRRHLRGRALDGDAVDGEGGGRPRGGVQAERGQQDHDPGQERSAGGCDPGQLEATARGAARWCRDSACRARTRTRAVPRSSPSGHEAGFAAPPVLPT
jgi:hypothetical protein